MRSPTLAEWLALVLFLVMGCGGYLFIAGPQWRRHPRHWAPGLRPVAPVERARPPLTAEAGSVAELRDSQRRDDERRLTLVADLPTMELPLYAPNASGYHERHSRAA